MNDKAVSILSEIANNEYQVNGVWKEGKQAVLNELLMSGHITIHNRNIWAITDLGRSTLFAMLAEKREDDEI